MTPQEKAKQLVEKFMFSYVSPMYILSAKEHSKQCALIAVDQIIIQIHAYRILLDKTNFLETNAVHVEHWQQVKQEINKL